MIHRQTHRFWRLALLWLLLLPACAPNPNPTAEAETATATFNDDFSAASGVWTTFNAPESAAYVQQGELYLEDRGRGIGVYTQFLEQTLADVIIQVTMRHVEGSQDNWMGVICRQQDEKNYTLFAISADGYYLILNVEDGFSTPLVGPATADAIRTGRDRNTLEVRCEGDTLTLKINDTFTVTQTDASFPEGGVALFTDAVRGGMTTTAFDDFALLQP
ncbi:MAG: hypothetical protein JW892_06705 [Anaerolineae bacterium]|nr:hypothetical protein [Anaerolineae bacterium]